MPNHRTRNVAALGADQPRPDSKIFLFDAVAEVGRCVPTNERENLARDRVASAHHGGGVVAVNPWLDLGPLHFPESNVTRVFKSSAAPTMSPIAE